MFNRKNKDNLINFNLGIDGYSGIHYLDRDEELDIDLFNKQQIQYHDKSELLNKLLDLQLNEILDYRIQSVFEDILKEHGFFYQKFVEKYIRQFIRPILLNKDLNQALIHKKHYPYLNIEDYSRINLKLFNQIELDIQRYFCALFFDSNYNDKELRNWFLTNKRIKKCNICGKKFRVVNMPDWIYINVFNYTSCCFNCQIVESNSKKDLKKNVERFVQACGFIPPSDYSFLNSEFTAKLKGDWKQVIKTYSKIGHPWQIKKYFESWLHLLNECRIIETIKTGRGVKCFSKDGHLCNSIAEKEIDDWLFENGVEHEKEPIYPFHQIYNPRKKKRGDWKVNDIFIEYFGLFGDHKYDLNILEKQKLSMEMKFEIIEIYPEDMKDLNEKLKRLKE